MFIDILLGERATANKELCVLRQGCGLHSDGLVHPWLSEAWLVSLVVSVAPIANNIYDDISLVFGAVIGGKLTDKCDGFRVITIYVENRRIDGFSDIGRVRCRSRKTGVCCEANLIIDNEMDCSTGTITGEIVKAHSFVDDALSSK